MIPVPRVGSLRCIEAAPSRECVESGVRALRLARRDAGFVGQFTQTGGLMPNTVSGLGRALAATALLAFSQFAAAQTAVLGANGPGIGYVFPNVNFPAGSCPGTLTANQITGLTGSPAPHGVGFYGSDFALLSSFGQSTVYNVQLSTASTLNVLSTSTLGYNGTATIAVAPSLSYAIAASGLTAFVLAAPFTSVTGTTVALPGSVAGYQTQAVVFNAASRAFIAHSAGISVLDPPYTSVAFTIPGNHEAVAITPDGNTLLATSLGTTVVIYTGPFSGATTGVTLTIAGASGLDGITVTPDGSRALVVAAFAPPNTLYSIAAPYSAASVVDTIALGAGGNFEDISVSADGLFAMLTGQGSGQPPIAVRGPFTTAGATPCAISNVPDRSNGAVRFLPTGLQPPPGPPPVPLEVPTLSELALALLALLAAGTAWLTLRRRRIG